MQIIDEFERHLKKNTNYSYGTIENIKCQIRVLLRVAGSIDNLSDEFVEYFVSQYRGNTRTNYRKAWREFKSFLAKKGEVSTHVFKVP